MVPNLGVWEILALLMLALLIFGAKRLPEIGSGLGKGIRNFKASLSEGAEDKKGEDAKS